MIIAGTGVASAGRKNSVYLTVMDLAPTFLELAGKAELVHDQNYVTVHSHGGQAMIRKGKWKLSNLDRPFDESKLELFDLEADPGETNNLALDKPEKYQELLDLWRDERKKLGIVLPQDL